VSTFILTSPLEDAALRVTKRSLKKLAFGNPSARTIQNLSDCLPVVLDTVGRLDGLLCERENQIEYLQDRLTIMQNIVAAALQEIQAARGRLEVVQKELEERKKADAMADNLLGRIAFLNRNGGAQ
jgi:chromosome segregation ATPase